MKWRTDDEQRPLSQTPNHRSNLSVDLSPFPFIVDLRCEIIRFEIHRGVIKISKKSFPKFLNFVNLFLRDNRQERFLRDISIGVVKQGINLHDRELHRFEDAIDTWSTKLSEKRHRSNLLFRFAFHRWFAMRNHSFEIHRGIIKIWKKSFPKFLNFVNLFSFFYQTIGKEDFCTIFPLMEQRINLHDRE